MGYCAAVFAAGKQVTTNSIIRNNLCIDNGRSPELARRQGDLYISTWEGGKLDGVEISGNTFVWTAPIDAPILQMDHADFTGSRPNVFRDNAILSTVPSMVHSTKDLKLTDNTWWYTGIAQPKWVYGGETLTSPPGSGAKLAEPKIESLLPASTESALPANVPSVLRHRGNHWLLATFVDPSSRDARSQAVWLQTALAQYGTRNLDAAVICAAGCENLPHDWHLEGVQVIEGKGSGTLLISPQGKVVAQWSGFVPPAELGLAVRWHAGGWRPPKR